jgi:hypothetical protein
MLRKLVGGGYYAKSVYRKAGSVKKSRLKKREKGGESLENWNKWLNFTRFLR